MKKIAIAGAGVAILTAGAVGLPYYVGIKAEESLRADHELIAKELLLPGLTITLSDYQRGWFSSTALTSIHFAPAEGGGEPLRIEVTHAIDHLPSLSHGAIASLTSEVVVPEPWKKEAERLFHGESPLKVVTYVSFTGNEEATISSPAFTSSVDEGDVTIEWRGAQGHARETRNNKKMSASLALPGLRFSTPQATVVVDALNYQVDMVRGSYDIWFGSSNADLKRFEFSAIDGERRQQLQLNNISFNTEQQERGTVTDGSGIVEIGEVTFDDLTLNSAVYDFEYRNFDTKTLHDIQNALRQSYSNSDPSQVGAVMLGALPALLRAQPEITIRRLEFKGSLGEFNGKLHLAMKGKWDDSLSGNPLALLAMLDADLELSVSKGIVQNIAHSQARTTVMALAQAQNRQLSEKRVEDMASDLATQQLKAMEANGYLQSSGELYTTRIVFKNGQLHINGKAANDFLGTT